ncbi:MAG: polyvinyl alcohol dehydrogenase (cytochrome) [Cryomorphaceae bacterium]|jgi:polyvinyl alcohol dehydrogenase (cytochrome)
MPIKISAIFVSLILFAGACVAEDVPNADAKNAEVQNGKKLFNAYCIACHTGAFPEAPKMEALKLYSPEQIYDALNSGVMSAAALMMSNQDIRQVAHYLTGKEVQDNPQQTQLFLCESGAKAATKGSASWTGWGGLQKNQRYQADETTINPDNVHGLELKWAFGFPGATRVRSQPTVTESKVYIGSQEGTVYALDAQVGCIHWTFNAGTEVRGAIKLHTSPADGVPILLFGDTKANAYSLNANTGALLWKTKVHEHALATITGSVNADKNKVYVPISSSEIIPASRPQYECCTFRGALAAVNLIDGTIAWKTYTTAEPVATGKNSAGTNSFGPSGAPIWSSAMLDNKRNLVIATTGQNYSSPATGTSDSVIAMDTATGEIQWTTQLWENDAWNGACHYKSANCPEENGPDFDVGTGVILTKTSSGKEMLLVGQKSGIVFGLNPDQDGKILWQQRVGSGGTMGGVHWGMSSDGDRLYVGVSDLPTNNPYAEGDPQPGLKALNPSTGEILWQRPLPNNCAGETKFRCYPGISAAVSSSPGLVFAGGMDGMLRAVDSSNGNVLWAHNTYRPYTTVNGVVGKGGSIEVDGPVIVNGQLYVTSGYDKWAEMPGNVLLVFSLPEK